MKYDEYGNPLPDYPAGIVPAPDSFFWHFASMPEARMRANIRARPGAVCFVYDGDNPGLYIRGMTQWNLVPGSGR